MAPNITVNVNLPAGGSGSGDDVMQNNARIDAHLIAEQVRDVMAQLMDEAAFDQRSAFTDGL